MQIGKLWTAAAAVLALQTTIANAQEPPRFELNLIEERSFEHPGAIPLGTGILTGYPAESWHRMNGELGIRNISSATLTPFLPRKGTETGAAIIIAPGGAFLGLSIDAEGYRIARWFADRGVAAFVLKYRVQPTPESHATFERENLAMRRGEKVSFAPPADTPAYSLADGIAAMKLVRARGGEWGVDPQRIGFMGFSAGAYLTLSVTLSGDAEAMPNFIAPIYGRQVAVNVPANAPPMFVAITTDDPLFWQHDAGLIESWSRAGKPVEFHLFQNGGHGFGPGTPGSTTMDWLDSLYRWIGVNGFLKADVSN